MGNRKLRRIIFAAGLFIYCPFAHGQIMINEFSAANSTLIADPDQQEYADWIELYNAGDEDAYLAGWKLSGPNGAMEGAALPETGRVMV